MLAGASDDRLFFLLLGLNKPNPPDPPPVPDFRDSPSPLDFLRFSANALLSLFAGDGLLRSDPLPTVKDSVLAGSMILGTFWSGAVGADAIAAMLF